MTATRQHPTAASDRRTTPQPAKGHRHLTFVGVSGAAGEIVTYGARSDHDPARTNLVSLDLQTREITCTCKYAETHPDEMYGCWHAKSIDAAWDRHPARLDVACLTDAELVAYGRKLAAFVRQYRERIGRALPADAVNLLAARCEYRSRMARNATLAA